jgi:hypothetical protein
LDHQQRQEGWSEEAHDELGACILLSYGFEEVVQIAVIRFGFYELIKESPPTLLCVWEVGSLDFGGFGLYFVAKEGWERGKQGGKEEGELRVWAWLSAPVSSLVPASSSRRKVSSVQVPQGLEQVGEEWCLWA